MRASTLERQRTGKAQVLGGKGTAMRPQTYREKTKPWYGTAVWKRRRAEQLSREPLCWMCKRDGRATAATVADHDPPHKGDEHAFWNGPLKSLCKPHHDREKQSEERTGRPVKRFGQDGWPVD